MKLIKFTKEGLAELKAKVEEIKEARPAAVKELTRAREMGDLSENGLYTAAKGRLRSMDSQLLRLQKQIKLAQVVATQKVTVEENGPPRDASGEAGKKIITTYEVVGDFEADPMNNKISANSPIGNALKYSVAGESVTIPTPKGNRILKVIKNESN